MKSERRHELKTNTLAKGIESLPNQWREYGGRILLGVLIFAIVFLLVRYWRDKKINDAALVVSSMETVHGDLQTLAALPQELAQGAASSDVADMREKVSQQIDQSINTVLNTTSDKKVIANAYLARGDMNWSLADFPELPGADTQPSLRLPNRDSLLEQASASYQKVLDPTYAANVDDVFYARLGLAAIAENRGKWDAAKNEFQSIVDSPTMPPSYKQYATDRLAKLDEYQSMPLLVEAPPPAPEPKQTPQALGPVRPTITTQASTVTSYVSHHKTSPTTAPASTQPATRP